MRPSLFLLLGAIGMSHNADDYSEYLLKDPELRKEDNLTKSDRKTSWKVAFAVGLTIAAIVGDLFLPSLKLGFGHVASFFTGFWFPQYVGLGLFIRSHFSWGLSRFVVGLFLSTLVSVAIVTGMRIAWSPAPPFVAVVFMLLGGAIVYFGSSWLSNYLIHRSSFDWLVPGKASPKQFSTRMLFASMIVCALIALGGKWIFVGTFFAPRMGEAVWLVSCFGLSAFGLGFLTWLELGAIRSERRRGYLLAFLLLTIVGFPVLQTFGLWTYQVALGFPLWGQAISTRDYELGYCFEAGIVIALALIALALPRQRPKEMDFELTEERNSETLAID